MTNSALQHLLGTHVIELSFVRRHPKLGWSNIRSMLGTTNYKLLNGDFGKQVLHFIPPKGVGMGYDYKSKGLVVVYDMMRQEYRVFGSEQVTIHQQWPLNTDEEIEAFHQYFYDNIINMTNQKKIDFMGYLGMPTSMNVPVKPNNIPQPKEQPVKQPGIGQAIKNKFKGFYDRVKKWFGNKK